MKKIVFIIALAGLFNLNLSAQNPGSSIPYFPFKVKFNNIELKFMDMSGLQTDNPTVKNTNSVSSSIINLPGIKKNLNATLKQGTTQNVQKLNEIISKLKAGSVTRADATIELIDGQGKVVKTWILKNAFPSSITGTVLNKAGNEAGIEMMVLVADGVTVK